MQTLINFFNAHPIQCTLALKAVWDAIIGALPAPKADSGTGYIFLFKLLNSLAFNFQRAASTSIERSPNFLPAVEKYAVNAGSEQMAQIAQGEKAVPAPKP